MYTSNSVFSEYQLHISHKPVVAAQSGPVVSRRLSPVLSRRELQRLILDMVD
jgi:hypothetical protein